MARLYGASSGMQKTTPALAPMIPHGLALFAHKTLALAFAKSACKRATPLTALGARMLPASECPSRGTTRGRAFDVGCREPGMCRGSARLARG
jgi:hypothetical protein